MAKRPQENQLVPCHCPICQGEKVPQDRWLRHHFKAVSKPSFMAVDLAILREIWSSGRTLKEVLGHDTP